MSNIRIHNKLPQTVTLSVIGENGEVQELRLAGNTQSEVLAESQLTDHVRNLAAAGHVKLRPA